MLVLQEEKPLATAVDARPVNYRTLMKKVEQLVATLDGAEDEGSTIQSLVESIVVNFRDELGIYGGRLRNCGQVEALTANLVSINRRYKAHAGLRITDV